MFILIVTMARIRDLGNLPEDEIRNKLFEHDDQEDLPAIVGDKIWSKSMSEVGQMAGKTYLVSSCKNKYKLFFTKF